MRESRDNYIIRRMKEEEMTEIVNFLNPSRHGISADDLKTCHDVLKQMNFDFKPIDIK